MDLKISIRISLILRIKTIKETQMEFYKVVIVLILIYGSKSSITRQRSPMQSVEIKFIKYARGRTRSNNIRN